MSYVSLDEPSHPAPLSLSPSRDKDYYWETIVLQVEDTLIRVPKYHLVGKSEVFDSMLSLPQGKNVPEGISDGKPIQLAGIKKVDFDRLLQIIYPIDIMRLPDLCVNGWVSVLALSTLWRMPMRKIAIEHLTGVLPQISPADRIVLGRKYSVARWISSGYEELASRVTELSLEEAERIGFGTALKIGHIRESLFAAGIAQHSCYCNYCGNSRTCTRTQTLGPPFNSHMVKGKAGKAFEDELKDAEEEEARFE